jgi:hypothetical protein
MVGETYFDRGQQLDWLCPLCYFRLNIVIVHTAICIPGLLPEARAARHTAGWIHRDALMNCRAESCWIVKGSSRKRSLKKVQAA